MLMPRLVLVLLITVGLFVCFAVPTEDLPETPYDESESLPYEVTPLSPIVEPREAVRIHVKACPDAADTIWDFKSDNSQAGHANTPVHRAEVSPVIQSHAFRC